jgi:hypothetical protein
MKTHRTPLLAILAVGALAALVPSTPALGQHKPDAGPLPRFDEQPFGDAKTAAPTPEEWKAQKPVGLTDPWARDCNVYRVREWIKITCATLMTSSIALLGGAREGVSLFIPPVPKDHSFSTGGEVIFPVRRGDRRMIEWSTFGEGYEGPMGLELAFVISESWVADEPAPVIIVR